MVVVLGHCGSIASFRLHGSIGDFKDLIIGTSIRTAIGAGSTTTATLLDLLAVLELIGKILRALLVGQGLHRTVRIVRVERLMRLKKS